MKKWMTMGIVSLIALGPLAPGPAPAGAQIGVAHPLGCDEDLVKGDLGISGLDCRGECTLTLNDRGEEIYWSFTVEPRVSRVDRGGPADGILQPGDDLVAIDGILITTSAGGRRFANVEPDEEVRLRYRRGGRMAEAVIHTGSSCPASPPPPPDVAVPVVGRISPPPLEPDEPRAVAREGVSPRVRVAGVAPLAGSELRNRILVAGVAGLAMDRPGRGGLGINFSCGGCGRMTDEESGEPTWFFSGPFEVIGVDPGGPADAAGIQIGDLIKAIDGHEVQSDAGGRAFSQLKGDEVTRLTVVKRSGREVEMEVVPEERTRLLAGGVDIAPVAEATPVTGVAAESRVRVSTVTPPSPPMRADYPEPVLEAPEGMPFRYSGTVQGVEVEVRGDPVRVVELMGARAIIINTDGLWIRIRIPGGGGEPEIDPVR